MQFIQVLFCIGYQVIVYVKSNCCVSWW